MLYSTRHRLFHCRPKRSGARRSSHRGNEDLRRDHWDDSAGVGLPVPDTEVDTPFIEEGKGDLHDEAAV